MESESKIIELVDRLFKEKLSTKVNALKDDTYKRLFDTEFNLFIFSVDDIYHVKVGKNKGGLVTFNLPSKENYPKNGLQMLSHFEKYLK